MGWIREYSMGHHIQKPKRLWNRQYITKNDSKHTMAELPWDKLSESMCWIQSKNKLACYSMTIFERWSENKWNRVLRMDPSRETEREREWPIKTANNNIGFRVLSFYFHFFLSHLLLERMTKFQTNPKLYRKTTCSLLFSLAVRWKGWKLKVTPPTNCINPQATCIRKWNRSGLCCCIFAIHCFCVDKISLEVDTFNCWTLRHTLCKRM